MRRRLHARALIIAAALLAAASTGARAAPASPPPEGLQRARQLVLRADALFALHRNAVALDLLSRALAAQTKDGVEYGYARYVRFRRARHLHRRGDTQRARAELIRALRISAHQDRVEKRYRVARHHPFIVRNFPLVAGISVNRQPTHAVLRARRIAGARGPFVYAFDDGAVYRLHRLRHTVLDLHHVTDDGRALDDAVVAVAVAPSGKQVAVAQRRGSALRLLSLDPVAERTVALPAAPAALTLDDRGVVHAYSTAARDTLRVHRLGRRAASSAEEIFAAPASLLQPWRDGLLYAAHAAARGSAGRSRAPEYSQLAFRHFAPARTRRLVSFSQPDPRTRAVAVAGPRRRHLAIFVRDAARNARRVLIYDPQADRLYDHAYRGHFAFPREPAGCLSFAEDYVVLLQRRRARVALLRLSRIGGQVALLAALPPSGERVRAVGVLSDNRTVWVHRGSQLLLVRPGGHVRTVPLGPVVKAPHPRWTGESLHLAEPEQLLLGWVAARPKRPAAHRFLLLGGDVLARDVRSRDPERPR